MSGIFGFTCTSCGERHEGSSSFAFRAPDAYLEQSAEIQARGSLGRNLCYYKDEDGEHYFIRVVLDIPIHGVAEPFIWGVWVSLSKQSYQDYQAHHDKPDINTTYFGWLCNYLPWYSNTYTLATSVHPLDGDHRPCITLHDADHELIHDFKLGISIAKAQQIAELCLHQAAKQEV
ncbi:DUF2199 domain-containing protein [Oceanisphaera arctica]|uniref:DUF2199 domain-containing protein n=1 Tax=Oceanisphaera arctica TaxID=641510 RepID=A0A2P5TIS9_9GAMM|nr:DUF2199 domain-containing protein [Oceanisphaera arctica]PPL14749.1 hypothetical protein UN63_14810 [Oceanisphaera arctica]GHA15118.1 hypothetical protein GCM10007082_14870 [Oceanisphaera arctica]